jgi:hypothetical protein
MTHTACLILGIEMHEYADTLTELSKQIEKLNERRKLGHNEGNPTKEKYFGYKMLCYQNIRAIVENHTDLNGCENLSIGPESYNKLMLELERECKSAYDMANRHQQANIMAQYEKAWHKTAYNLQLAKAIVKIQAPQGTVDYLPQGMLEPSDNHQAQYL